MLYCRLAHALVGDRTRVGGLEIREGEGLRPSVPRDVGATRQSCAPALKGSVAVVIVDDSDLGPKPRPSLIVAHAVSFS